MQQVPDIIHRIENFHRYLNRLEALALKPYLAHRRLKAIRPEDSMMKTLVETIRRLHLPSRLLAWIFGRFASDDQRHAEKLRSAGDLDRKTPASHTKDDLPAWIPISSPTSNSQNAEHHPADVFLEPPVSVVAPHHSPVQTSLPQELETAIRLTTPEPERRLNFCFARLGIGAPAQTLEAIGSRSGVTRERVRQVVERTLSKLANKPVAEAFRTHVGIVLSQRECVTTSELLDSSTWFGDLNETGLKILLDAFIPDCCWSGLVSFASHETVNGAVSKGLERMQAFAVADCAYASVETIAIEVANGAGLPRFSTSLATILRKAVDARSFTMMAYVCNYVARSVKPVTLAEVKAAALSGCGRHASGRQIRNALSNIVGIYPLGESTFGTFKQVFDESDKSVLDQIAAHAVCLVESEPSRQHTAAELFSCIRECFGDRASSVTNPYELAVLLRHQTSLRYLGRMVFGTVAHTERFELLPLARRVLEDAGSALAAADLVTRMRAYRDMSPSSMQAIFAQLVEVRDGFWDLPDRLVLNVAAPPKALSPDLLARAILVEDAFAALRPGESLAIAELRGRLAERGSKEAEEADIQYLRSTLTEDDRFTVSANSVRLAQMRTNAWAAS